MLGLEIGADDYLCKPFSMRELMARVKVLLRRAALDADSTTARAADDQVLVCRPLGARSACAWPCRGTAGRVPLTVTEFLLLQALARRPGIVKTREQLMQDAYPDRVSVSDRTIDSHVKRIRRKFQAVDPAFDRHRRRLRRRLSLPRVMSVRGSLRARLAIGCDRRGSARACSRSTCCWCSCRWPASSISTSTKRSCSRRRSAAWCSRAGSWPRRSATASELDRRRGDWRCCAPRPARRARIRIYDAERRAARRLGPHRRCRPCRATVGRRERERLRAPERIRERVLYRVGAWLVAPRAAPRARLLALDSRIAPRAARPPSHATRTQRPKSGPRSRAAMAPSVLPDAGPALADADSAVPIRCGDRVIGAALVSQSTFGSCRRSTRSVCASSRSSWPRWRWLRPGADGVGDDRAAARAPAPRRASRLPIAARTPDSFRRVERRDEIGDLARSARRADRAARRAHPAAGVVRRRRVARVQESAGVDPRRRRR